VRRPDLRVFVMGFRTGPVVTHDSPNYRVLSYGRGSAYEIIRKGSDGDSAWVQDDEASQFRDELDATHDGYTFDDVCGQLFP
jgi:hypothetical protein